MGAKMEVAASNRMEGEFFIATPAIAAGDIYIRGQNTLYCIRGK
jgi:hypothetical protein